MDCLQFLNWIRCFTMFPLLSMPLENWSLEPFSEVSHGVLLYLCQSVIQPYRSVNPTPATSQELFKVRFVVMNPFFPQFSLQIPPKNNWFSNVFKGIKRQHWEKKVDRKDVHRNWLKWFLFIYFMKVLFIILAGFMNFLSPFIVVYKATKTKQKRLSRCWSYFYSFTEHAA